MLAPRANKLQGLVLPEAGWAQGRGVKRGARNDEPSGARAYCYGDTVQEQIVHSYIRKLVA